MPLVRTVRRTHAKSIGPTGGGAAVLQLTYRDDIGALGRILGDDFLPIDVMPGPEVEKPDLLPVLGSGQLTFEAIQPVESQVRLYGITAVITGRTQISGRFGETPFTASSLYTHVFVKDQSQWRLVSAQGMQIVN